MFWRWKRCQCLNRCRLKCLCGSAEMPLLSDLVRGSKLLSAQISANLFSPESRPVTPLAEVVTRDTLKLACWRHAKTITSLSHYHFFHVLPLLDRGT